MLDKKNLGASKVGHYPVKEYLGVINSHIPIPDGTLEAGPVRGSSYRIEIGINKIINLDEITTITDFKLDPEINFQIKNNSDFFKVTVVTDFVHGRKIRFSYSWIGLELVSDSLNSCQVYSISPQIINSREQINKEYAVNPQLKIVDTAELSFGSFTYKTSYEKLHPLIVGHFSGGKDAWWEYNTDKTVNDIIGTQIIEFVIKQSKGSKTEWRVFPDGKIEWNGIKNKAIAIIKKEQLDTIKKSFKTFVSKSD
jgi:hypothetical protein